jgi:hypothetical protein
MVLLSESETIPRSDTRSARAKFILAMFSQESKKIRTKFGLPNTASARLLWSRCSCSMLLKPKHSNKEHMMAKIKLVLPICLLNGKSPITSLC